MSIEAMEQALEALNLAFEKDLTYLSDHAMIARQDVVRSRLAITALRAAIAEASMQRLTDVQQEMEQEPVAWKVAGKVSNWSKDFSAYQTKTYVEPVYTHPPRREWVGLTDEEIAIAWGHPASGSTLMIKNFARALDAILKEKNSG